MKKYIITLTLIVAICSWAAPVFSQNPFTSKPDTHRKAPAPSVKSQFFVKLIYWQHQLKQKMSELIREARNTGRIKPLIFLMALAFSYGAVHAAGPGHGKFMAMSYVLSHKASVMNGLLFGIFVAFMHGLSGAVAVLGLRYIIQRSVSETLAAVTTATQIISFGLIALLGLGVLLKNGYALFFKPAFKPIAQDTKKSRKGLLPWTVAVGLVPCPAVVMVMLFCLSMDVLILGLSLAACISLGMAATISCVVIAIIMGKAGALQTVPKKRVETLEHILGLVSGIAVTVFGTLFLLAAIV